MKNLVVVAIVILICVAGLAQQQPPTTVFVIGGIHQSHEGASKYTYERMGEIYKHLRPEVLCVEGLQQYIDDGTFKLMPRDFSRFMVPQAKKDGIPIVGIDWWNDNGGRWLELQRKSENDPHLASANEVWGGLFLSLNRYFAENDFEQVNAPEVTALWAAKNRLRERVLAGFPEYRFIPEFERERNDQMLAKTVAAVNAHPGKRILVAVGIDHKFFLEEGLRAQGVRVLEVADVMTQWWK